MFVVPFALIQLLLVSWLSVQAHLAEEEVNTEERYKTILDKTTKLPMLAKACMDSLGKYAVSKDKKYSDRFDALVEEIPSTLKDLRKGLADNKEALRYVSMLDEDLGEGVRFMTQARSNFEKFQGIQEAIDSYNAKKASFQATFTRMLNELSTLSDIEHRYVSKSNKAARNARKATEHIIQLSALLTVCLLIGLGVFFAKTIVMRLLVMVDNTQRFKSGAELNPVVWGNDEIALLDKSFHDMADEVLEAQRMRQTFVAMISHDLRTPLTAVQGYLTLVTMGAMGDVPEQALKGAAKAEANVDRLIRLINDLLFLEKMEAGKMQMTLKVVYLEDLIQKSVDAIEEFAKGHDVKLVFDETNAEVNADPDRLIQVIINLASNAVKFSPKGETVEIKTIEESEFVEVQVIDKGRGVPAKYVDLIFEKYKQVKEEDQTKKGGTGLGLPICKMIVEQLGGSIGVRSEEGKGSTFWFRLPLKFEAPAPAPVQNAEA